MIIVFCSATLIVPSFFLTDAWGEGFYFLSFISQKKLLYWLCITKKFLTPLRITLKMLDEDFLQYSATFYHTCLQLKVQSKRVLRLTIILSICSKASRSYFSHLLPDIILIQGSNARCYTIDHVKMEMTAFEKVRKHQVLRFSFFIVCHAW